MLSQILRREILASSNFVRLPVIVDIREILTPIYNCPVRRLADGWFLFTISVIYDNPMADILKLLSSVTFAI